jgi:tetratricopeptide (TPR) repeat protein
LIAGGDTEQGYRALEAAFRDYPNSGIAPAALRQYLSWLGSGGEGTIQTYLEGIFPLLGRTELDQHVLYEYAESVERDGRLDVARARYLALAHKYPYPHGALWDDALWHAADIDAKLGDPKAAIGHLEEILAPRETSYMSGSYERGRYAEARFKIAELYRDALGDSASARAAFERLFAEHKTSRLRDDAAWNAALLAEKAGDRAGACRDLRNLVAEIPDSRYAPCSSRLCPEVRAKGDCHEYLMRTSGP